jgi:hypothetical protein
MAKRRKPPPSPPTPPSQGWMAPLAQPITLKDGTQFHSLGDAAQSLLCRTIFKTAIPGGGRPSCYWRPRSTAAAWRPRQNSSLALFSEARYVRQ